MYLGGVSVDKFEEAGHFVAFHEGRASRFRDHEVVHGLDEVAFHVGRGGREATVDNVPQYIGRHEPVLVTAVGITTGAGTVITRQTALTLCSVDTKLAAVAIVVVGCVTLTADPAGAAAAAALIELSLVCTLDGVPSRCCSTVSYFRGCLARCSCC